MFENIKNIFFETLAINFIEFYMYVTPIYCISIATLSLVKYTKNSVEKNNLQNKNFYKFVISMSYMILLMSVIVGFYANFTGNFNVLYVYTSNVELFSFSLDCLKLYFLIISNLIMVISLISFKDQDIDKSFYDFVSIENEQCDYSSNKKHYFLFIALVFTLHAILHFMFITDNILVFFIFFEASIIPIFSIIGFFGKRSIKFKAMNYILYFTLVSAIPLLLAIVFIWSKVGTFYYPIIKFFFYNNAAFFSIEVLIFLFFCFFIPFAVKLALFPFHTWLPEAHVESSTEGSIILSGIMLKLGFYGIIKFCIGFFAVITLKVSAYIFTCAILGSIATSFAMYKQLDIKKVIAYSSVVHMNIAICGFFSCSQTATAGALLFSFSHALSSAGLFCAVGYLHDKLKTRNLLEISGLCVYMPKWSFLFFILILTNASLPGTISFVSEITLIGGLFEFFPITSCFLLIPIVVSSYRNFILFTQLCMGVPSSYLNPYFISEYNEKKILIVKHWDINIYSGEGLVLCFICFFSVYTGLMPAFFINLIKWTAVCIELGIL